MSSSSLAFVLALAIPTILYRQYARRRTRISVVQEVGERVLILGGSRCVAIQTRVQSSLKHDPAYAAGLGVPSRCGTHNAVHGFL